ncbi:hypothetical protein [Enterococcus mundtii]
MELNEWIRSVKTMSDAQKMEALCFAISFDTNHPVACNQEQA